jgi:hypothetical protein
MSNSNCLAGMACPRCRSLGPFVIEVLATARIWDDGAETFGDIGWTESNSASCEVCRWEGTVGDLYNVPEPPTRTAVIAAGERAPRLETVERYLPRNYTATLQDDGSIRIEGYDQDGWTLDGYVIPRLASGMIYAREV